MIDVVVTARDLKEFLEIFYQKRFETKIKQFHGFSHEWQQRKK